MSSCSCVIMANIYNSYFDPQLKPTPTLFVVVILLNILTLLTRFFSSVNQVKQGITYIIYSVTAFSKKTFDVVLPSHMTCYHCTHLPLIIVTEPWQSLSSYYCAAIVAAVIIIIVVVVVVVTIVVADWGWVSNALERRE
eukprot:m.239045 g.239045  ORF g.239045 m.239045 type:complete len:139 (+) comp15290_c0_seq1:244-660(+)